MSTPCSSSKGQGDPYAELRALHLQIAELLTRLPSAAEDRRVPVGHRDRSSVASSAGAGLQRHQRPALSLPPPRVARPSAEYLRSVRGIPRARRGEAVARTEVELTATRDIAAGRRGRSGANGGNGGEGGGGAGEPVVLENPIEDLGPTWLLARCSACACMCCVDCVWIDILWSSISGVPRTWREPLEAVMSTPIGLSPSASPMFVGLPPSPLQTSAILL